MSDATDHIAAWEAAGLIDPRTADRLRAAEAGLPTAGGLPPRPRARRGTTVAAIFGPGVAIGEMFGYLGLAFVLAAVNTFVVRLAGSSAEPDLVLGIGLGIQALLLAGIGIAIRSGDARRQRAAGAAFLLAVGEVAAAAGLLTSSAGIEWPVSGVIGTAFALLVAVGARLYHGSLLTHVAVLGAFTGLAATTLAWVETVIVPPQAFDNVGSPLPGGPDLAILAVASAGWWIVVGVFIGLGGLLESRAALEDPSAGRRAALSRLWAGALVVSGVSSALMKTVLFPDGTSGRVIEPAIADIALLVIAAILVERAFRREASSYVYAAALGLIVALTDFNLTYLSQSTETGLLIEGLILLGAGFGADRLRRRLGENRDTAPDELPAGLAAAG